MLNPFPHLIIIESLVAYARKKDMQTEQKKKRNENKHHSGKEKQQ